MWQVDKNQMGALGLDESLFATTEDVAAAVSFLVSDEAGKITGEVVAYSRLLLVY